MPSTPPATPRAGADLDASSATIQADAVAQRLAAEKANEAAIAAQRLEHERQATHDATLACALQAEEEATAMTKDRDATAQRASKALVRAAKERVATATAVALEPSGAAPGGTSAPPHDLRAAMLHHEAVALL